MSGRSDTLRPKQEQARVNIDDWPEIKNGVPALKTAKPVTIIPIVAAASGPAPATLARTTTLEAQAALPPLRGAVADAPGMPGTGLMPAQPPGAAAAPPPVSTPALPSVSAVASAPTPRDNGVSGSPSPIVASAAPESSSERDAVAAPPETPPAAPSRPPARPAPAKASKPKPDPRQEQAAKAQNQPTASRPAQAKGATASKTASAPPVTAAAEPAKASPQEERAEVFGMPLPSFVPTGRKIKESVESLGDAVMSLPGRL